MIGYLSGRILEIQDGKAIIAIQFGASPGNEIGASVGYSVTLPTSGRYGVLHSAERIELWIHTHVREDALDLYGFLSREEKEIFLTLLTVNGIGPKGALGILSKVEIPTLVSAILEGNQDALTEIPGIGKKTAERVVVELKDTLKKKAENGSLPADWLVGVGGAGAEGSAKASGSAVLATVAFKEARDALVGLGYREQEVVAALKRLQDAPTKAPSKTEEIVKSALKELR